MKQKKMAKKMAKQQRKMQPRILVLEGLWSDTERAVRAAGGHPIEASPWDWDQVEEELSSDWYHGLLLTGGSDINPRLYNEAPHKECYGIDNLRDRVELRALQIAKQQRIPVLGICRGSQIMNAFTGGRLCQHIEDHSGEPHAVYAAPKARTFKRAIGSRDMRVISLHHQCVETTGKGMRVAAYANDGTPEAIESHDGKWLGVQFHPEINAFSNANSFAIFQWLVREAGRKAGIPTPLIPFRTIKKVYSADAYFDGGAYGTGIEDCPPATSCTSNAIVPYTTRKTPRKAGDPSLPSMRTGPQSMGDLVRDDTPSMADMEAIVQRSLDAAREEREVADALAQRAEDYIDSTGTEWRHDAERGGGDCRDGAYWSTHITGLLCCPFCAIIFDDEKDMHDHVLYLHESAVEPPADDPAWNDHLSNVDR